MERFSDFTLINVPGLEGSGSTHWQTIWEKSHPQIIRAEQEDWINPVCQVWVSRLEEILLKNAGKPIVLIGHSLGCGTIIHAAGQNKLPGVVAAFLVALPDIERADFPNQCLGFSPMPHKPLNFTSTLLISEDDQYIAADKAREWAGTLGAVPVSMGSLGHMGDDAHLEDFAQAKQVFINFLQQLREKS